MAAETQGWTGPPRNRSAAEAHRGSHVRRKWSTYESGPLMAASGSGPLDYCDLLLAGVGVGFRLPDHHRQVLHVEMQEVARLALNREPKRPPHQDVPRRADAALDQRLDEACDLVLVVVRHVRVEGQRHDVGDLLLVVLDHVVVPALVVRGHPRPLDHRLVGWRELLDGVEEALPVFHDVLLSKDADFLLVLPEFKDLVTRACRVAF
mmetsp:Transcript_51462/g.121928  ORF Transcript_51462/g.121928 Transcript_51462/m.121928 type:complete len:207 (+) Transcript_51462:112-732(+)